MASACWGRLGVVLAGAAFFSGFTAAEESGTYSSEASWQAQLSDVVARRAALSRELARVEGEVQAAAGAETAEPQHGEQLVERQCMVANFSAVRCVFTANPLHDDSYGTKDPFGKLVVRSVAQAENAADYPFYWVLDRTGLNPSLTRWQRLVQRLRRKADKENLSPCQRVAMASCVTANFINYRHDAWTKLSGEIGLMDEPNGECTEFSKFETALLGSLGVKNRMASVGPKGSIEGDHAMVDVFLSMPGFDSPTWFRIEPQWSCRPNESCTFQLAKPWGR
jgi:hypothetical protein